MKWADERFNTKPNRLLNSYFYSVNLDKDKEYFTSGNGANPILPSGDK